MNKSNKEICERCKKPIPIKNNISNICECPYGYRDLIKSEIKFLYHYGIPAFRYGIVLEGYKLFRKDRRAMEIISKTK